MEQVKKQVYKVVINKNGTFWYNEQGKLHRENGPAAEYINGDKVWYLNGECHREDGPAEEYADGTKCWFLNNKHYSETEFNQIMSKKNQSSVKPYAGKTVTIDGVSYKLV